MSEYDPAPGIEPETFRSPSEHANLQTTGAVKPILLDQPILLEIVNMHKLKIKKSSWLALCDMQGLRGGLDFTPSALC